MKAFFRDPANLRHSLNTIVPVIVFLTSVLSAIVACNVAKTGHLQYVWVFAVALFSTLCVLLVILAMTQPLKEVVAKAEKLVKSEEIRKEKSQMMEVYQLIEKLMEIVKSKDGATTADRTQVMKNIEKLDYVIPLGYMSLMVAHEVRNPLSTITGMSELLKERAKDDTERVYLDTILNASRKIDIFTKELLDFTDDDIDREEFDLDDIVREAAGTLSTEFDSVKCEPPRDSVSYVGDRNKIYQAVYNILRNAFEFENDFSLSQRDEGRVNIAVTQSDPVTVSIHNPHSKIEKEDMEALFKPFFTRKKKGRGIGLFISMRNVKMHQGDIAVESGDEGTTFTITLPAGAQKGSLIDRR